MSVINNGLVHNSFARQALELLDGGRVNGAPAPGDGAEGPDGPDAGRGGAADDGDSTSTGNPRQTGGNAPQTGGPSAPLQGGGPPNGTGHAQGPHVPGGPQQPGNGTGSTSGPQFPGGPSGLPGHTIITGGRAPQGLDNVIPSIARQVSSFVSSLPFVSDGRAAPTPAPAFTPSGTMVSNVFPNAMPAAAARGSNTVSTLLQGPNPNPTLPTARAVAAQPATQFASPVAAFAVAQTTMIASPGVSTLATGVPGMSHPHAVAQPGVATRASEFAQVMPNRAADGMLQPARADAALASRAGATVLPGTTVPTTPATVAPPANPAVTLPGTTQVVAIGLPLVAPLAALPADAARGVVLVANDHAASRMESGMMIAGHTLEGMQRRRLRTRVSSTGTRLTRWLYAFGGAAPPEYGEESTRREVERVFQWLFWIMAIVAYVCAGLTIVALVGNRGQLFDGVAMGGYTSGLAVFGLAAAVGAWWLARKFMRRGDR